MDTKLKNTVIHNFNIKIVNVLNGRYYIYQTGCRYAADNKIINHSQCRTHFP